MPSKISSRLLPRQQLSKLLLDLQSSRKPARVVTIGGKGPRGAPSSWKCANPRMQSLVEEDCQRIAEIAISVTAYETHPCTLDLGAREDRTRYTPDLLLWCGDQGAVVEVKPEGKLKSAKTVTRLKHVVARLDAHGIPLVLLLDTDVRTPGLQRALKLLQRDRPVRGRFQADLDASLWDPRSRIAATTEQLARWTHAQQVCDDLLQRVMRRDPGELLNAA
jgi:hypothetical protein